MPRCRSAAGRVPCGVGFGRRAGEARIGTGEHSEIRPQTKTGPRWGVVARGWACVNAGEWTARESLGGEIVSHRATSRPCTHESGEQPGLHAVLVCMACYSRVNPGASGRPGGCWRSAAVRSADAAGVRSEKPGFVLELATEDRLGPGADDSEGVRDIVGALEGAGRADQIGILDIGAGRECEVELEARAAARGATHGAVGRLGREGGGYRFPSGVGT